LNAGIAPAPIGSSRKANADASRSGATIDDVQRCDGVLMIHTSREVGEAGAQLTLPPLTAIKP
jgi:hypothetical protein